ncbi:MAG TPA: glutamate--cysteine ligase, partial [Burkholderiaceae bacterium]
GGALHMEAVSAARAALLAPETLPSARVLAAMQNDHAGSFTRFVLQRSQDVQAHLLALPFSAAQQARFAAASAASIEEQKRIEAADTMPFDVYLEQYLRPERLGLKRHGAASSAAHSVLQAAAI